MGVEGVRPSGVVAFLFTDVEGSTRWWEHRPADMELALATHDEVVRRAIVSSGGYGFSTQGDSFAAAFSRPEDALVAATSIQAELARAEFPDGMRLEVRIGVHVGTCDERDGDYFGRTPTRAARIMSAAGGGQVLVSGAVVEMVDPDAFVVWDLGVHRLRDIAVPVHLFELDCGRGQPSASPLTIGGSAGNLPPRQERVIGREAEVTDIARLVEAHRVVTLVGAGGIGKTTLSVEVARSMVDRYRDGVWLAELGEVRAGSATEEPLLRALGISIEGARSVRDRVIDILHDQQLLMIVDNCEHVIDQASEMIAAITARCADVTVLATSRQPLSVAGERVVPVSPLGVDAGAVDLYLERARATGAALEDDPATRAAAEELCLHLDGLPLAIELAASRARSLPPAALLGALDERFRLLAHGRRAVAGRQRTLHATVDWSYDLLSPVEQRVFRRASVFVGSFDADGVAAVVGDDEIDRVELLDTLGLLVDQSMCVMEDDALGGRFRLLETMREYGRDRLDEHDERSTTRLCHCGYMEAVAARLHQQILSRGERAAAVSFREASPDFYAAVQRGAERGDGESVRRLCQPLWPLVWHGFFPPARWVVEVAQRLQRSDWLLDFLIYDAFARFDGDAARALLDELAARTPDGTSSRVHAHLFGSFLAATLLGDYEGGMRHADQASQLVVEEHLSAYDRIISQYAAAYNRGASGQGGTANARTMIELSQAASWATGESLGLTAVAAGQLELDLTAAGSAARRAVSLAASVGAAGTEAPARYSVLGIAILEGRPPADIAELALVALEHPASQQSWSVFRAALARTVIFLGDIGRYRSVMEAVGFLRSFRMRVVRLTPRFDEAVRTARSALGEEVAAECEARGRACPPEEFASSITEVLRAIAASE